jgi:YhcH/YjgK/YiaL family protein
MEKGILKLKRMIVDSLENAYKYIDMHKSFAKAFQFINNTNFNTIEAGKYPIDGPGLHAAVSVKDGVKAEEAKYEAHNSYIDIQVCPKGSETIGWKPRQKCKKIKAPYNPEKDVTFYETEPDTLFKLHAGQFVIFFPEDVHGPMIGEGPIKKLVVKVKI